MTKRGAPLTLPVKRAMNMKSKQLIFAREYRGFTQKALSAAVSGLSQSNLSKYENGAETLSDETVERVMAKLGFPTKFLDLNICNSVENKHYRKKASINATARKQIDRTISLIAYCFDWMSDFVELPDYKLGTYDLEMGISPSDVARQVRRQCKLGTSPVKDICTIFEANGIFIYSWNCQYDDFDGVSLITDKGFRLVIINGNRSNDRIRWTLAHEMGHCLMHENITDFINENRDKEKEANEFAGEFLMPESETRRAFTDIRMSQLGAFKSYWLTSMSSIVERAKRFGCISSDKYIGLRCEFSRNRWNKKEPISVYIDKPTIIGKVYDLIKNDLKYSPASMAGFMGLPLDIVDEILGASKKIIKMKFA